MSLAPCPPSSPSPVSPSYAQRRQNELDTQFLHLKIQQYYLQQQQMKQQQMKHQEQAGKQLKQQQRHISASTKKDKISTSLAAEYARVVAVGPIPLERGRKGVATPNNGGPPDPPRPSPAAQKKEYHKCKNYVLHCIEGLFK
jgi:hypothetical protein